MDKLRRLLIIPVVLMPIFLLGLVGQEVKINGGIAANATDNDTRDNVSAIKGILSGVWTADNATNDNLTAIKAGVPIVTVNDTWTLRRDNITAADTVTTLDNSSLIDLGAGANGVCLRLKDNVTGTVTVRVYGFDGTDNNTVAFTDVNVELVATTTQDGRYCSRLVPVDTFGIRYIKTPQIITAIGSDNISVATKPY